MQHFYNLDPRLPRPIARTSSCEVEDENGHLTLVDLCEEELRKVFGPAGRWRSDTQREAGHAVVNSESPLVIILPTAGGKSALIWIPVKLDAKSKTTIVVVATLAICSTTVCSLGLSMTRFTSILSTLTAGASASTDTRDDYAEREVYLDVHESTQHTI